MEFTTITFTILLTGTLTLSTFAIINQLTSVLRSATKQYQKSEFYTQKDLSALNCQQDPALPELVTCQDKNYRVSIYEW